GLCRPVPHAHALSRGRGDGGARRALPHLLIGAIQQVWEHPMTRAGLVVENLTACYVSREVLCNLSLAIPPGKISAIVGANASGKSTLLRAMSRLLAPRAGQVVLDGKSIHHTPPRQLAQVLGLVPQSPIAPEGITVADLVSRGRHPHQGLFARWTREDDAAVESALEATAIADLAE